MKFSIEIRLTTFVKKWFDENIPQKDGVYLTASTPYYYYVNSMASRSISQPRQRTDKYPKDWDTYIPVRISVTSLDFYRYGWIVNPSQIVCFNKIMRNVILNQYCYVIAALRSTRNIQLTSAIEIFQIMYDFSDYDIKPETLRKHYNRNFLGIEAELSKFSEEVIKDYETNKKRNKNQ